MVGLLTARGERGGAWIEERRLRHLSSIVVIGLRDNGLVRGEPGDRREQKCARPHPGPGVGALSMVRAATLVRGRGSRRGRRYAQLPVSQPLLHPHLR